MVVFMVIDVVSRFILVPVETLVTLGSLEIVVTVWFCRELYLKS